MQLYFVEFYNYIITNERIISRIGARALVGREYNFRGKTNSFQYIQYIFIVISILAALQFFQLKHSALSLSW